MIFRALAALTLAACASTQAPRIELAELAGSPESYRGQVVRTCGWATNAFEDVQITVSLGRGPEVRGFEADWREGTAAIVDPEWRCVTGRIEPICGDPDALCISTGSPYTWVLIEE